MIRRLICKLIGHDWANDRCVCDRCDVTLESLLRRAGPSGRERLP